jgi:hypothetical protein
MNESARNYHAHGGAEWVVGGKLTFLPGAIVEGAEGLFNPPSTNLPEAPVIPYIPDSEATTVAQLRDSFNKLLKSLKEAGVMASAPGMITDDTLMFTEQNSGTEQTEAGSSESIDQKNDEPGG